MKRGSEFEHQIHDKGEAIKGLIFFSLFKFPLPVSLGWSCHFYHFFLRYLCNLPASPYMDSHILIVRSPCCAESGVMADELHVARYPIRFLWLGIWVRISFYPNTKLNTAFVTVPIVWAWPIHRTVNLCVWWYVGIISCAPHRIFSTRPHGKWCVYLYKNQEFCAESVNEHWNHVLVIYTC